ncbi:malonate decarboxylase subunit alpha [uncultured Desulfosarcina sp.]|uniref:acetyl-CoA hydrolase/transferase family protein n=1 Tax=uncultured Desulfosarcina sp. TaxID=218289 RepID=UPI0029C67DAC|nr:malonate decarboxylase subunit alpha [uncultured Desulfosarcina sp.]
MKIVKTVEEMVNNRLLPPGSRIFVSGAAATPRVLCRQLAVDSTICDVELFGSLFLGDVADLFSEETCRRITHRIVFNSDLTREAANNGWAKYQLMHLSDIPAQVRNYFKPDVALISVAGPDNGGNYSLGTTVEGTMAAVEAVRAAGGIVIAERNAQMPFVLGDTVPGNWIDYLIDTDYPLPVSPIKPPDEASRRIGRIIAGLFVHDRSTIQYGIGQVPEAVTDAILEKGVNDLGIHSELFADAMRRLVEAGVVTNRYTSTHNKFSIATFFLAGSQAGYDWLDYNSSVQSRPVDYTNGVLTIAAQPNMVAINSAIGVDLHGNIWADSMKARKIYSGVGGQCDFIRGANLSQGGVAIIALRATTGNGISKIVDMCPEGITTTSIAADQVVIVTENGAFDPRGLGISERVVGIAHLASEPFRDQLLKTIYESPEFHHAKSALSDGIPKGFVPYDRI